MSEDKPKFDREQLRAALFVTRTLREQMRECPAYAALTSKKQKRAWSNALVQLDDELERAVGKMSEDWPQASSCFKCRGIIFSDEPHAEAGDDWLCERCAPTLADVKAVLTAELARVKQAIGASSADRKYVLESSPEDYTTAHGFALAALHSKPAAEE